MAPLRLMILVPFYPGADMPPPQYRSDQSRLLTSGGHDLLQFATMKGSGLQEQFLLQARPSDIKSVARLLRETGVLVKRFPEEEKPGIADVLSTQIIVSAAGRQEKRVYYRKLPNELLPLKAQIERLIELTKGKGQKDLCHQGKPILPADFEFRYQMTMGTAPPEDYYEYIIHAAAAGNAEFSFFPEGGKPFAWRETFQADSSSLESLYRRMANVGGWTRPWHEQPAPPEGGIWRWLEAVANQRIVSIPPWPEDPGNIGQVYKAIRVLVPARIWRKVHLQQPRDWEDEMGKLEDLGKLSTASDADPEVGNKQVLAHTFRNLVRYALRKTRRDVEKFGVTPSSFSIEAMDESLTAHANSGIFGAQSAPSVKTLLNRAHEPSLTFHFFWKAPTAPEPLEVAFALSYDRDGNLEVRLLWLGLPERVPISPSVGAVGGLKPLAEAVFELLRVREGGRLAPYPPPA